MLQPFGRDLLKVGVRHLMREPLLTPLGARPRAVLLGAGDEPGVGRVEDQRRSGAALGWSS